MSQQPPDDIILDPIEPADANISAAAVVVGLLLGLVIGLFYTWQIDPVVIQNTAPNDLQDQDRQLYVIAAAQEYAITQNLPLVVERLVEADPDLNPFELAAQTTCELIRSGRVNSVTDIDVIRNLRAIYEPQGQLSSCDTAAFNTSVPVTIIVPTPTVTFTPSITPVATKTPTKVINPPPINSPLPTNELLNPDGVTFREAFVEQFCDATSNGVIEVYVREANIGTPLPGIPIEITDSERNISVFYTGLKPERGEDYADFVMTPGASYRVGVQGNGQPSRELFANTCDAEGTVTSYRVVIQRVSNQ